MSRSHPLRAAAAVLIFGWLPSRARADDIDGFKSCLCGVRDANGDGVPDLAIANRDRAFPERVWIVSGKDGTTIRVLEGAQSGDGFGAAMCATGDLNGDGVTDVMVGASGCHWEAEDHSAHFDRVTSP